MSQLIEEVKRARSLPSPPMRKAIREGAHVSQTRMGAELDVHRVTVARWEAGTRQPRAEVAARYADLLAQLQAAIS